MNRKLGILAIMVLALALAASGAFAQAQEKSWDVRHERIYSIDCNRDMTVLESGGDDVIDEFLLRDAGDEVPDEMRGDWTITKNSGNDIEIEVLSDGGPGGELKLVKGAGGEKADFDLTFTSNELVNTVSKRVYVYIIPAADTHPTDYIYAKTEHAVKTGLWINIPGGKAVPEGIEKEYSIRVTMLDASSIWGSGAGVIGIEPSTGAIEGFITKPGVYEIKVRAYLMSNLYKDIAHTFTVTGAPVDHPISPFELNEYEVDLSMLQTDGDDNEFDLCWVHLRDPWGRMDDEFSFDLVQTAGKHIDVGFEEQQPWEYRVFAREGFAAGEYKFEATLRDVTRDEEAVCKINVKVKDQQDALPDGIYYDNIKPVMTLKAGKSLTFKAPKFRENAGNMPANHHYYLWIEDIDGDLRDLMTVEDNQNGMHTINAVELGAYTIHAGVSMFDGTRGTEIQFKLNVEPGKGALAQGINIVQRGDWDKPYEFIAGEKVKLKVEFTPKNAKNKKLIWQSTYPEGISVSDKGVLTAREYPCEAEIHVTAADGSGVSDMIVVSAQPPKATKLAFNKKKASMKVGGSLQLTVKYTPKSLPDDCKGVSWASDNSAVVEVNQNGELYAKAPGKAVIYAYAIDPYDFDNMIIKNVFAKCTVTVK